MAAPVLLLLLLTVALAVALAVALPRLVRRSAAPPRALRPGAPLLLPLVRKTVLSNDSRIFRFALPSADLALGLPVGQHVVVTHATPAGDEVSRPYTPVRHAARAAAGVPDGR